MREAPGPTTTRWVSPLPPNDYVGILICDREPGRIPRDDGGFIVLNRFERTPPMAGEAEVRYLDGDFRVIRPGAFVRCGVTGVAIPLEELKYWSVELQEAYSTPDVVLQRHFRERVR
jgi:hypothetical protein